MDGNICFLVTLSNGASLIRCALKVCLDDLGGDVAEYPMEPENMAKLKRLLPSHVQSFGSIVDVTTIFEVTIAEQEVQNA